MTNVHSRCYFPGPLLSGLRSVPRGTLSLILVRYFMNQFKTNRLAYCFPLLALFVLELPVLSMHISPTVPTFYYFGYCSWQRWFGIP